MDDHCEQHHLVGVLVDSTLSLFFGRTPPGSAPKGKGNLPH